MVGTASGFCGFQQGLESRITVFDTFPRELPASASCPAPQGEGKGCQGSLEGFSLAQPALAESGRGYAGPGCSCSGPLSCLVPFLVLLPPHPQPHCPHR